MQKNKIIIEWYSIIRDLLRNLWVMLLAAIIGVMGIYIASYSVYSPEYTATSTLVVTAKSSTSNPYSLVGISSEIAEVYTNVFEQPIIREKAAAHLQRASFDGKVTATVLSETNLMSVNVTSPSPQTSYELLGAVLEVYPEVSDNIFENATISIIKQPAMPHSPSNSITSQNKLLVAFGCAFFTAILIAMLSVFRDTVKNEDAFNSKVESKLIGTIVHEDKRMGLGDKLHKKKKALLIHSNAFISLKFVESYHKIAAKLEHHNRRSGDKFFAVTSVAENEGKSTVASNIALSLADRGYKVILFDLDAKKPALYKIFGESYDQYSELGELFENKIKYSEFKLRKYKKSSLYLALNTKPYSTYRNWIESGAVEKVIGALKTKVDYIIVDTAPFSVDASVTDIVKIVDKTMVVVRTDVVTAPSLNDALATLKEVGGDVMGCVLNDVHPELALSGFNGFDEGGYYYGKRYGKYNRYSHYGKYGTDANTARKNAESDT